MDAASRRPRKRTTARRVKVGPTRFPEVSGQARPPALPAVWLAHITRHGGAARRTRRIAEHSRRSLNTPDRVLDRLRQDAWPFPPTLRCRQVGFLLPSRRLGVHEQRSSELESTSHAHRRRGGRSVRRESRHGLSGCPQRAVAQPSTRPPDSGPGTSAARHAGAGWRRPCAGRGAWVAGAVPDGATRSPPAAPSRSRGRMGPQRFALPTMRRMSFSPSRVSSNPCDGPRPRRASTRFRCPVRGVALRQKCRVQDVAVSASRSTSSATPSPSSRRHR